MKRRFLTMITVAVSSLAAIAQPYPTTDNIVRLTEQNMPAVEYFTAEKVKLPEIYANAEYHIYNDDIAIIINYTNPQPFVITFYNLNTKKIIAGFFKKGELRMASGQMRCNDFIVTDGILHTVSRFNIDSVLVDGFAYTPTVTQFGTTYASSLVYVDENTIAMPNSQYITGDFGVEGLPEFLLCNAKTGKPLTDYKQNNKNFPSNLTQRSIAYCNSKYVAFWHCFPIITIYDKDFNLVKMYRDDKFEDPEVAESKMGQQSSYLSVKGFASFFRFDCQTDNYIIAANGRNLITGAEVMKKGGINWVESPQYFDRFKDAEIWCFDNDMNLVRRYKCKNKIGIILKVSYNEKTENLFIAAKDANGEVSLYRCKFNK